MGTGDLFIAALLLLLGGAKARAAMTPKKAGETLDRISKLQARANQAAAKAWIPDLIAAGMSPEGAEALSRWIGIESSGNPSKPSPSGEYGLLQCLPSTAKEIFTPGEWLQLKDPTTSRADHAKLAVKQYNYHRAKAGKWVKDWTVGATVGDNMFYAKLHHARPKDLSDAKMSGPAAPNAAILASRWKNDSAALQRLAAASVVAWGTVSP